jgi:hypothetical protein
VHTWCDEIDGTGPLEEAHRFRASLKSYWAVHPSYPGSVGKVDPQRSTVLLHWSSGGSRPWARPVMSLADRNGGTRVTVSRHHYPGSLIGISVLDYLLEPLLAWPIPVVWVACLLQNHIWPLTHFSPVYGLKRLVLGWDK